VASKEWTLVGVTALAAVVAFNFQRGRAVATGDVADAAITVVPADEGRLACATSQAVGPYRCEYDAAGSAAPPVEPKNRVAPYLTLDRTLYLVPGLFEVPSVRAFAARHGPNDRFVARCKVRLVEPVTEFKIRFQPEAPWEAKGGPNWLAEPVSCNASP
jgi:hypothetical protein